MSKQINFQERQFIDYIITHLRYGWSPEQVAGRLKREHGKTVICHETIYRYIYAHPEKKLAQYLVRNHKRRRRKSSNYQPRRGISNRVSIHDRPEEVESRETFGHWELDTVEGKGHVGGITTALERKTRYYDAQKISKIDSHTKLNKIGIKTSFCDPYCSWQKGANDNHNGILRRYISKKTDFSTFTQIELDAIISEINNRPRKCLNYETFSEAFNHEL